MKSITFLFLAMFLTSLSFAQNAPIDFEAGGHGSNWSWAVFENNTNPALDVMSNPVSGGINTSDSVAKFTALQAGQPWAGFESAHGAGVGQFVLDSTNSLIKIKVYKTVLSDVGIKLVSDSGWALPEIKVANTVINQWEELTFDFSAYTNPPAGQGVYDQIAIFPDFNARTQDNIIYLDDITFNANNTTPVGPSGPAPTPPAIDPSKYISIFSDAFNDEPNTDFNPSWGQSTVMTTVQIQSDNVIKYVSFNYQGITLAAPIDVSAMGFLHIDVWSADVAPIKIYCISSGPVESGYTLSYTPSQWESFDIPMSTFSSIDLTDVFQLKFDGGTGSETFFIDNIYFYIDDTGINSNGKASDFTIYPNPVNQGEYITISDNMIEFNVYDISGKLVQSGNAKQINTSDLTQGMYIVQMTNDNGQIKTEKFVVK